MSKKVNLNIDELKLFVNHIIDNNRYLQSQGKLPVTINVEGEAGVGKTSAIIQVAKEKGLDFVRLNLAEIEELGDLVGFPIRQFELCKDDQCIWVDEPAIDTFVNKGYSFTGNKQMSYCPPEWIAGRKNGGILLLDDYSRADHRFMQATMTLIETGKYISWSLPNDWHIILTSNPDNGEYMVTSLDDAQKTRFISVNLKFDIQVWARWAESVKLDSRCINFMLMHPELLDPTGKHKINARSATTFFNSISSIPVFENQLPLIQNIGEGSVGTEFSTLFTLFINNRLDKLISPIDMLTKDEGYVLSAIKSALKDGTGYRGDIAGVLSTRLVNHCAYQAVNGPISQQVIDRIIALTTEPDMFKIDINYYVLKTLINSNHKFSKLMINPKVMKMAIK